MEIKKEYFSLYLNIIKLILSIGISQGAQSVIGYNYGVKQFDRMKEALKISMEVITF